MPRACTICTHPERPAIDRALLVGSFRAIARRYDVHKDALLRHEDAHLPLKLVKAQAAREVAQADSLLDQVQTLRDRALGILDQAEKSGDFRSALGGIREARACLELLAELEGRISRQPIGLILAPEWLELRLQIIAVLAPYPEARQAVIGAISERAS